MKAQFALFLALSSALTCAVDSIVAANSPRRSPPSKPLLNPRFPNVAPLAPPACLLACVGQTAHGCPKEFTDFGCMCTANGKIVEQCLNQACPRGNAPKALVAFNDACKAQLKVVRAPRVDSVASVVGSAFVNSTASAAISAVAPTFSVGPVTTKSSSSGPLVVTVTTKIVTTSTPEPTVLTLTTALVLTSQSTTSSTLRFPVPSDTPPVRIAKREIEGTLTITETEYESTVYVYTNEYTTWTETKYPSVFSIPSPAVYMGLATSGRAFIAQQYDAAQSVDSLAESVLEQITGPRGQMDPNEMVAASVAASMAAADTVTESVTVTTSIGKTKKKKVSTTVATVTTTDASGITVAVEVTLTTKAKKNEGVTNGLYGRTPWLVSFVVLLVDLLA
ncbi:uncharacterized protein SAPINGB_P004603 [Magnusiomyces paraingens]|uniref:CFEM domain-containing protein n=1 Tax=Magnusiomyces paraingens TaxID=2606893 RepID=A0A5E8BWG3_9ASCO|nr:uncharacterized protein SAPINGB_P004603 [Saprochaete ingens]VVT55451.1 unnamed protein product [Saprochaete ingens]